MRAGSNSKAETGAEEQLAAIAELLKQELLCGTETAKAVAKLRATLKENASGQGAGADAEALEKTLARLGALEEQTRAFLQNAGAESIAEALEALPPSPMRTGVQRLAVRAARQQRALRTAVMAAGSLLEKSRGFIDFHVNLMSQAVASDTYAPPGAESAEPRRGRQMFDANV